MTGKQKQRRLEALIGTLIIMAVFSVLFFSQIHLDVFRYNASSLLSAMEENRGHLPDSWDVDEMTRTGDIDHFTKMYESLQKARLSEEYATLSVDTIVYMLGNPVTGPYESFQRMSKQSILYLLGVLAVMLCVIWFWWRWVIWVLLPVSMFFVLMESSSYPYSISYHVSLPWWGWFIVTFGYFTLVQSLFGRGKKKQKKPKKAPQTAAAL